MTTLKDAVTDLLQNRNISLDEAADRHFSPEFRQRTNGQWDDRARFVTRIADLRDNTRDVVITVLDEFVDGQRYAERHIIELLTKDGLRVVQEVSLFALLDSAGRFERIEEVTLAVGADDEPPPM